MRKTSPIGNSLAYLLSQNEKRAMIDGVITKKTSSIGNSLAYLLCHKQ